MLGTKHDHIELARTQNKIAIFLGLEGGHLIASDLGVLRSFAGLGARYLTLTHSANTELADSATDRPVHNGLSHLGRQVVRELNQLGMLVDVSHVSDQSFYHVLEESAVPIIASHSCCRSLCHVSRNLSDPMIKDLAGRGGLLQINFHTGFLDERASESSDIRDMFREMEMAATRFAGNPKLQARFCREASLLFAARLPRVSWRRIVEHINHAVELVGPDHVGLGSDFDGGCMPEGMEDISKLPQIAAGLMAMGYPVEDIQKIMGGNVVRLLMQAESFANMRSK